MKLILAFLLLISLQSGVIAAFFYSRSIDALHAKTALTIMNTLHQQARSFDDVFENIYYLSISLSIDDEIMKELADINPNNSSDDNTKLLSISSLLNKKIEREKYIDSVYIYLPKADKVVTTYSARTVIQPNETKSMQDFRQPLSGGDNWFSVIARKDNIASMGKNVFSISKDIKSTDYSRSLGKLWINVDERIIYFNILENIRSRGKDDVSIIDSNGIVVSNRNVDKIGTNIRETYLNPDVINSDEGYYFKKINNEKMMIVYVTTKLTNYKILYMIPEKIIISEIVEAGAFVIRLSLILIAVCLILGLIFSMNIYKPINKLEKAMREVSKGNFDIRIEDKRKDEFGILNEGFNQMTSEVSYLFNEVYKQKLLKKEAELNALQSQITPHFLYNTLNSIRYAAMLQNATIVSDMLSALVELLQLSAGKKEAFISVREEIQQVKNYVILQMFRYRDLFSISYEIDEEVLDYKVPKLILQPLVENSIQHGISLRKGGGKICIRARKVGSDIVFEVEDNGVGMTEEKIREILYSEENSAKKFCGIGIKNVNERIKLYFGEPYGLTYRTAKNGGTIARILIPCTNGKEGVE